MSIRNIGVGVAEEVKISIKEEDCWSVIEEFNKTVEYSKIEYADRKENIWGSDVVVFADGSKWDFFRFDEDISYPYILANADQECKYMLPSIYACLVNALMIERKELGYSDVGMTGEIPDIPITIEYVDVQGVSYCEEALIHTEYCWIFGYGFLLTISII